jgi:protein TonB
MWAGAIVSGVAHGALIALALQGVPWLVRREPDPPQVVEVSFVSPAQLAALQAAAATREAPAPAVPEPTPPPEAAPPREAAPPPDPPRPAAEPVPEPPGFAPAFDAASPLGPTEPMPEVAMVAPDTRPAREPEPDIRPAREPEEEPAPAPEPLSPLVLDGIEPPLPRPAREPSAEAEPSPVEAAGTARTAGASGAGGTSEAARSASFELAVRAAIARAQVYPLVAKQRGITGSARVELVIARDGTLVSVRLARSSGFAVLDRASLEAVRNADIPAAPPELTRSRFDMAVTIAFALD